VCVSLYVYISKYVCLSVCVSLSVFVSLCVDELQPRVVGPVIQARNFELKPVIFQMLNSNGQYAGLPHEEA